MTIRLDEQLTCSSFLDKTLIMRSSSASYALMRSSCLVVALAAERIRCGGENDIDIKGRAAEEAQAVIRNINTMRDRGKLEGRRLYVV